MLGLSGKHICYFIHLLTLHFISPFLFQLCNFLCNFAIFACVCSLFLHVFAAYFACVCCSFCMCLLLIFECVCCLVCMCLLLILHALQSIFASVGYIAVITAQFVMFMLFINILEFNQYLKMVIYSIYIVKI